MYTVGELWDGDLIRYITALGEYAEFETLEAARDYCEQEANQSVAVVLRETQPDDDELQDRVAAVYVFGNRVMTYREWTLQLEQKVYDAMISAVSNG